jgi:DNA-binding MarR family transcriptional regulator
MTNQLGLFGGTVADPDKKQRNPLSFKQRIIMAHLNQHGTMTLDQAVKLIGGNIYYNQHKHVGAIMARMVRKRLIRRIKPGVYTL